MPIYVDVTEVAAIGGTTGVQRVVREIARRGTARDAGILPVLAVGRRLYGLNATGMRLLDTPAPGAAPPTGTGSRIKAALRQHAFALFGLAQSVKFRRRVRALAGQLAGPVPVEPGASDTLILIDTFWNGSSVLRAAAQAQRRGARIVLVIYDLFPIRQRAQVDPQLAHVFPRLLHRAVAMADRVLTISQQVRADVLDYFGPALPPERVRHFYLGQDFVAPSLQSGPASLPEAFLVPPGRRYLMIGTLEPRRGHAYVLDGFDALWAAGGDQRLLLVGKIGWNMDSFIARCRAHPQLGRRLFLLHDAPDATLAEAVAQSDAVIVASFFEGFGLPLVEALLAKKPVLASDIPIFREIAADTPLFFPPGDADALAGAIRRFEEAPAQWQTRAAAFRWIDWEEATRLFFTAATTTDKE